MLGPLQVPHAYIICVSKLVVLKICIVSFIIVFTYLQAPTNQYGFAELTYAINNFWNKDQKEEFSNPSNISRFLSTNFDYTGFSLTQCVA